MSNENKPLSAEEWLKKESPNAYFTPLEIMMMNRYGQYLMSLASPDKEAVRFYEWVEQNRYEIDNREQHAHTIDQLYTIFKTSK